MHGHRYVSKIREDLTFNVLNLFPDYTYPGKIVRVDISVTGAANEDKVCRVEIELHTTGGVFEGGSFFSFSFSFCIICISLFKN